MGLEGILADFTDKEIQTALNKSLARKVAHEMPWSITLCTCPNCTSIVDEFEPFGTGRVRVTYPYCKHCGQHLDWSEER